MFVTKNISVHVGINNRGHNGWNQTWLGYSYGSWLPKFSSNKGRKCQIRDYKVRWLCFHGSLTIWPKFLKK